jgi:plastocyanin
LSQKNATGMSKIAATALVLIVIVIVGGVVIISNQIVNANSVSLPRTTRSINAPSNGTTTTISYQNNNSVAEINQAPEVVPIKLEWCNTDNSGQDRFCASNIQVVQGDIVQVLFIQNDSDAHTFTLTSGPYNFQINDTIAGQASFLQNGTQYSSSCVNGNYSQESLGVSSTYCVSGTSLLSRSYLSSHNAANYAAEQNRFPHQPFGNPSNEHPTTLQVTNQVYSGGNSNLSLVQLSPNASSSEVWGIGSFQASFAGVFEFTCVYHLANGMFGYITVLPNQYCITNPVSCGLNSTSSPSGGGNKGQGNSRSGSVIAILNGSSTNVSLNGFAPQTITLVIGVNNTVTWMNNDFTIHTVTANNGAFDSGFIQPSANYSMTFNTPGTYQYHCSIHAWMKGTLIVVPKS